MTPTNARLTFLRHAGFDLAPDPENIRSLLAAGWSMDEVAETYRVSVRTIQRYLRDPHRCPTPGCPVMTPGGRLCHFDQRTEAMK